MNRFLLMIAAFWIALIFGGCATMQGKWEKAAKEDTIASYRNFIAYDHPNQEYEKKAQTRIRELEEKKGENDEAAAFEAARRQESPSWDRERREKSLREFLTKYPSGKHAAEAKKLIEQTAFERAKNTDAAYAFSDFISNFPSSDLVPEATARLRKLRHDNARKAESSTAYMEFIKQYPEGPDTKELENDLPRIKKLEQVREVEKQKFDQARELGRIALKMAPVIMAQTKVLPNGVVEQRGPLKVVPPADIKFRLDQFRKLLKEGADPGLIRIKDFRAHYVYPNGFTTSFGQPGEVVSAKSDGITLQEYFRWINLKEGVDLLKKYTGR
jgi:hypothetical protein